MHIFDRVSTRVAAVHGVSNDWIGCSNAGIALLQILLSLRSFQQMKYGYLNCTKTCSRSPRLLPVLSSFEKLTFPVQPCVRLDFGCVSAIASVSH